MLNFLQKDVDITHLSNFKTKAKAKYFFELRSVGDVDKFKDIYEFARQINLEVLIIGGGTNMLFAFDKFEGIIVKNSLEGYEYNRETQELIAFSNHKIWDIALDLEHKFEQNIWHRFIGLPGSVGGAVFGNAGCFGLETESNFVKAEVLDLETFQFFTFTKEQCDFSYRDSIFKKTKKYFIIKAYFDLSKKVEKYTSDVDNIKFREEIQPKGNSCGSFFTNPSKEFSAGKLIEEVGLKGFHYKNAFFSEKHANFLMTEKNNGNYKDLLYLIDLAQKKVKEKFEMNLIPEVRIITNKDEV